MIDIGIGKEVSNCELGAYAAASPAVAGPRAFLGTLGEQFVCANWQTAKTEWVYAPKDRTIEYFSSAAVKGNRVVVGGRDKRVHGFDAASGAEVWNFQAKSKVESSPLIVGERAFIGSHDGNLYELDLATGAKRWQFAAGAAVASSPVAARGRLVVASEDGSVYCFAPAAPE